MTPVQAGRIFTLVIIGAAACGAGLARIVTPAGPTLVLRSSRMLALPGQEITLTAEVVGPETEAWYCPRVVWRYPDGTESSNEGDCPEWAPGVESVRRWTKRGSLAHPGTFPFEVRLEKPKGHTLARASIVLTALGGE